MVRPTRKLKPVNYSQFEDSGSDDDFISSTVPLNKKSKTESKELKQVKPKPNPKNSQKEDILPEKTPRKRMALDDKVFQRGLEVALALSVKELSTNTNHVQPSQDKGIANQGPRKAEIAHTSPRISNCSVASDHLDLDKITEEDDSYEARGKRQAAAKAQAQQRKMLMEGSDGDSAGDTEPESAAGEGSEQDSDSEESEGDDEDFSVRKSETKEIKKKEVKIKSPVEKREKKSKSKCSMSVTSVDPPPAAVKSESQSSPKAISLSSEATRKPAAMCSPSAKGRRPKWVPPASCGSGGSGSSPLAGAPTKSPSQSLRLGLSRLARVKPLHPNATSSQVW